MSTATQSAAPCVLLSGISWEKYVELREVPESRNVRMTYDQGVLELMAPSKVHERVAELLGQLIVAWTEEKGIARQSCGSMTFKRQDLRRGLEPDKCFYLQNEASVRNRKDLDLTMDPPPDLVIELDVTGSSLERLPLYATMGVPEVWHWKEESLRVLALTAAGSYAERADSVGLPGFPFARATSLLDQRFELDETTLVINFRRPSHES